MKYKEIDINAHALSWVGKIHYDFGFIVQSAFKKHGLDVTKEEWSILKRLHVGDGKTLNDMAYVTHRDKVSMMRIVNSMVKKNYIIRRPDELDKRINRIFLTGYGKKTIQQVLPIMYELIPEVQESLSQDERDVLIAALQKVKARMEEIAEEQGLLK